MPVDVVDEWIETSNGHTGYMHDWKDKPEYAGRFQASVDSVEEYLEAKSLASIPSELTAAQMAGR